MSLWLGIFLGATAVFSWKIFGYLVPHTVLDNPRISRIASLLTVALLSALTGVQMLTGGGHIQFDARIPALALAAILLRFKAPFIVMVAAAAAMSALLRLLS
ncbi:MAG: AzlD domain-containing protein [Rhodoluna sp.]